MDDIGKALAVYAQEAAEIIGSPDSTEATFYPAVQRLLTAVLKNRNLPFTVRVNTSQRRGTGGTDLPDLALYDGAGDFVTVFGEIKLPSVEIADLAVSGERNDQIGRYLAQTRVVLLTNIRSFGLVSVDPAFSGDGPVPPERRRLLETVDLWASAAALSRRRTADLEEATALADLVETAVTEFASIAEPESLARVLARQAKRAKADLPAKFSDAVQPLLDDFAEALGLTFEGTEGEEFLRSSLIQTAFYSLFAGWTLWHHAGKPREFDWRDLGDYLKIPFLGALFYEFRHPVRLKELGLAPHLERATATLHRVVEERFFRRFALPPILRGNDLDSPITNAIQYFYEPFLEAFDPDLRKELGVWYTPQEIVRYQVRKVDRLLRDELECPRGFADDRVVVLDPCCGTGAYLIEVVRCVAEQLQEEGAGAALAGKLLDAVCRRILGFEILTAPFVVAQLQLYLILSELGLEPDESHRPAIFLTNALTGWDGPEQLKLQFPELQQEHDAAQRVKREAKIIVILGNPPYNRFVGAPMEEEQELADHYKGIRRDAKGRQDGQSELYRRFGIRKQLLDDLYVRFFRLAEIRIGVEAEYGVVSWISNSSYLAGRSHPLMRESLLRSFDRIWIDNLNGDKYRTGKVIPKGLPGEGTSDQSVFSTEQDSRGIQVGTAVGTFLKARSRGGGGMAQVWYRDFWGMSAAKRQALLASLRLDELPESERLALVATPEGPREYDRAEPAERTRWKLVPMESSGGYEDWPALDELFPAQFHGVNTNRGIDGSVIETDRDVLEERMQAYFSGLPWEEFAAAHPGLAMPRSRYEPEAVRNRLRRESRFDRTKILPYVQFPLDKRWIYYELEAKLLSEPGPDFAQNLEDNKFLVAVPQPRRPSEQRPMLLSTLFALHVHDRGAKAFPVRTTSDPGPRDLFSEEIAAEPTANLQRSAWDALRRIWALEGDLSGEPAKQLVLDLFRFALAIAHAPQYQLDHKDALAHDWIHLPIPKRRNVFQEIVSLGEQVSSLLDPMTDPTRVLDRIVGAERRMLAVPSASKGVLRDDDLKVTIPYFGAARGGWEERAPKESEAAHPAWGETTGDLYLNETAYLANVPERVWRFELGGYPVIKKWLGYRDQKRRPDQPLTYDELDHLRSIVHRLAALLRLHAELDQAYDWAIESPFTAEDLGL